MRSNALVTLILGVLAEVQGEEVLPPVAVAALATCGPAIAQGFAVHRAPTTTLTATIARRDPTGSLRRTSAPVTPTPSGARPTGRPSPFPPRGVAMPAPTRPAIITAIYLLHADPEGPRLRLEEDMKIALVEQLAELPVPTQQRWERRFADAGITLEA